MNELVQYLDNYFDATAQELDTIASYFKPKTIGKGDYLLKTGRIAGELSFINSGLMRIYVQLEQKEITQWVMNKGYFVTDLASFMFQSPARWNIQALTDCELFSISKKDYDAIGNKVQNWHRIEKAFISKCFITLENRVFSFLSQTAEERYHRLLETQPELFNLVPLQYLASMLGMTPETLSRLRKKALS